MGVLSQMQSDIPKTITPAPADVAEDLPASDLQPCRACGEPLFWHDIYGGGPHCANCRPWPSLSLVSRKAMIAINPHGGFAWDADYDDEQNPKYRTEVGEDGSRVLALVGFRFSDPYHGEWD